MAEPQTGMEDASIAEHEASGAARKTNLLDALALPLILLAALIIRMAALGRNSLYFDELYNIMIDRLPLIDLLKEALAAGHPPLYYLLAHFWYSFGTGVIWARSLSVLAGLAVTALAYAAAKELFDRRIALWSAALVAVSPILFWYTRAIIYYSWVAPVALFSFWMLVRAARRGSTGNWIGYYLATVAVFLTYFFAAAMLAGQWLAYWLMRDRQKSRPVSWLATQAALVPVVIVSYLFSRHAISTEASHIIIPPLSKLKVLIKGIGASPAVLMGGEQVDGTAGGHLTVNEMLLVALVLVVIIAAVIAVPRLRQLYVNRKIAALALYTLALVGIPLTLQFLTQSSILGRYYVWAAPTFLMIVAVVIASAPRRLSIAAGLVVVAGLMGLCALQYDRMVDADWRALMGIVQKDRQQGDELLCFSLHNCVIAADYYLEEPLPVSGGFLSGAGGAYFMPPGEQWTGYASGYWAGTGKGEPLTGESFKARVAADTAEAQRLWLITAITIVGDKTDITHALEGSWQKSAEWDFDSARLELYVRE